MREYETGRAADIGNPAPWMINAIDGSSEPIDQSKNS